MKKRIMIITILLIFILPLKVYASTTTVEINVSGKIQNGQEVNIIVNMTGLEGLYAASVDFAYNKNDLKILSIEAGDSIKKYEDEIMELGGEVDDSNNKTSYSFTFLGDKKGIFGDGTLVIIKAEILNANNFKIATDSMKIKLVKRSENSVENYDYKFIRYSTEKDVSTENKEENNTNNKEENDINNKNEGNNKEESNNIANENVSIPNTESNTENNIKEENTSGNIEDKVEIGNNTNKEENTFWDNILNGNIVESIISDIKNFISSNNSPGILNEEYTNKQEVNKEEINKEYDLEEDKIRDAEDKVNESISKSGNDTDSINKNDEDKVLQDNEYNVDKQDGDNIYIYFIGTIVIVVVIYGIYKLKIYKNR